MKKLLTAFLCFVSIISSADRVYADEENVYVHDTKEVIEEAVEDEILKSNTNLMDVGDARIYVVTLDSFDWNKNKQAKKLLEQWGLDDEQIDNSLLLMLALEDEEYHCYVGSNLKSEFSKSITDNLLVINFKTEFREKRYSVGVRKAVDALYRKAYNIYVDHESVETVFELEDGLFYKGYPVDVKAEERRKESFVIMGMIVAAVPLIIYIMFKCHDSVEALIKRIKKKYNKKYIA